MGAAAARVHDPVAHSEALGGFLAGALVGVVAAAGVAALVGLAASAAAVEIASGGLATPLVVGAVATVGEFGVNLVVGGLLTAGAEHEGEALGSKRMGPKSGEIADGSPNVQTNGRRAARTLDSETCHDGKLAEGSKTVHINGRPAARAGDKLTCGGAILDGSLNVRIGGPTARDASVQSEVPTWVRWAVVAASALPALGAAARAAGSAIAEVSASGFSRAAQVGAKALTRAMEERAGGGAPNGVPISKAKFDEVSATPAGRRPAPDTYLPQGYTDAHLAKFKDGASYLVPTKALDRFGRDPVGRPDGQFVMPRSEMDDLLARTGGDTGQIEQELGIPTGSWNQPGQTISRIDVASPQDGGLRMPSGNESGANPLWMPGGKLPGGGSEAVIDPASTGSFTETIVGR